MELIVLGSSGSWPSAGRATSGSLVTQESFNFWIDLGTGTLARLQEHIPHPDVHAARTTTWISTSSSPRVSSTRNRSRPSLFMPPGAFDLISCTVPERTAQAMRETFDLREVEPGASFEAGPFQVETRPMHHTLTTLGLRLRADVEVMAYTADTGPTEEVGVIGRDADLLLSEATYLEPDQRAPLHLSARQAGEFAARSNVGRLVLTHVCRATAMEAFGGDVAVAGEGLRLGVRG